MTNWKLNGWPPTRQSCGARHCALFEAFSAHIDLMKNTARISLRVYRFSLHPIVTFARFVNNQQQQQQQRQQQQFLVGIVINIRSAASLRSSCLVRCYNRLAFAVETSSLKRAKSF
jgi:uncharacterized protein